MCGRLTTDRVDLDVNNTCLSDTIVKTSRDYALFVTPPANTPRVDALGHV